MKREGGRMERQTNGGRGGGGKREGGRRKGRRETGREGEGIERNGEIVGVVQRERGRETGRE